MDRPLHVDMTTIASTRYHDGACTKWNKRRPRRRHAQRPPGEDVLNGGFGLFSLLIDCSNVFSIQIHFLPKKKKKKKREGANKKSSQKTVHACLDLIWQRTIAKVRVEPVEILRQ